MTSVEKKCIRLKTKNSFAIVKQNLTDLAMSLRKTSLPNQYRLVSLDVVSLLTKIPKELVYDAVPL